MRVLQVEDLGGSFGLLVLKRVGPPSLRCLVLHAVIGPLNCAAMCFMWPLVDFIVLPRAWFSVFGVLMTPKWALHIGCRRNIFSTFLLLYGFDGVYQPPVDSLRAPARKERRETSCSFYNIGQFQVFH